MNEHEREAASFLGCFFSALTLIGWLAYLVAGPPGVATVVALVVFVWLMAVMYA